MAGCYRKDSICINFDCPLWHYQVWGREIGKWVVENKSLSPSLSPSTFSPSPFSPYPFFLFLPLPLSPTPFLPPCQPLNLSDGEQQVSFSFHLSPSPLFSLPLFMSPTEGEGDILFLVRILLALALALASAWHFLVCTISHEPVGGF